MALDAATLALTAAELKTTLTDAKIAKLFEPTRDELVLTLRTRTETYSLLLSARSGSARVCLTEESFENPETNFLLADLLGTPDHLQHFLQNLRHRFGILAADRKLIVAEDNLRPVQFA